jgi:pseudouridine-5'-phosphate glycosidase
VEQYGDQYREWVAEAHADLMQPRKFADMMRERMAQFNGQSTLNVGLPIPEPIDVDADELAPVIERGEMPSDTERLIRAAYKAMRAFIEDLQT